MGENPSGELIRKAEAQMHERGKQWAQRENERMEKSFPLWCDIAVEVLSFVAAIGFGWWTYCAWKSESFFWLMRATLTIIFGVIVVVWSPGLWRRIFHRYCYKF
jgi:membrane protein YdbS with pleckstrin-like domain